jgi:pimeloyl-ACP methyl ester carboxylesterase
VIVPYLRGHGSTRFLSSETFRNGQPYVVALDIVNLMDALKIQKALFAGFDWGGRTADIIAILWPERCKALVSVSGYLIAGPEANKKSLPPRAELQWWSNTILLLSVPEPAMTNTAAILRSSFGRSPRSSRTSMMPHSSAQRHPSTIRITSPS